MEIATIGLVAVAVEIGIIPHDKVVMVELVAEAALMIGFTQDQVAMAVLVAALQLILAVVVMVTLLLVRLALEEQTLVVEEEALETIGVHLINQEVLVVKEL
jgi:flagellar biogenesis protein FliO